MSLHFDFALACDLKPDTPQQVLDTLAYMTRSEDYPFDNPPEAEFFGDPDWKDTLQRAPEDTYFPGSVEKTFRLAFRGWTNKYIDIHRYTFSFRCPMSDDSFYHNMPWFTMWLAPYSETVGYVGYYREEAQLQPTLIYFKESEVYLSGDLPDPAVSSGGGTWPQSEPQKTQSVRNTRYRRRR